MEEVESFYGHGKVLLTSEYYVLDGAQAIALPTKVGQKLNVRYRSSYDPHLYWKSLDHKRTPWYEGKFEFWHFNSISGSCHKTTDFLQKLLRQTRLQNTHFLRDEVDVLVETQLEFPLDWGLGSSSTLIHNLAQWAYVSPFELLAKTLGGSGYDIACAEATGPIVYQRSKTGPTFSTVNFDPSFEGQLFFIYLGKKQSSLDAREFYQGRDSQVAMRVEELNRITKEILQVKDLNNFERLLTEHEKIIAEGLKLTPIKKERFSDYWGTIKSLGAWGGDFALVTSERTAAETYDYFKEKNIEVFIPYSELVMKAHP